ncbi:hypothetical protein PO909_014471, partial [Leuciscus waleckii]
KEINTFIHQGCIKLIKSYSKDIYNFTIDSISNKGNRTFYSSKNPEENVSTTHQIIILE